MEVKLVKGCHEDQLGQSSLEFVLTSFLFLAFFFFYFQVAMAIAFGSYAHYATFMAARAYMAAGSGDQTEQAERARNVLVGMVKQSIGTPGRDKFPSIARGTGGGDPAGFQVSPSPYDSSNLTYSWFQGVRYTFQSKLFLLPIAGIGSAPGSQDISYITLVSESWLGREPGFFDCQNALSGVGIFDNGC